MKYHHKPGESPAEEKERLLELAVKFGLINIKQIPHETGKMARFSEQFGVHLESFLQDMGSMGESRFDENKMLEVILGYVKKYPSWNADLYEYLSSGNKKANFTDLRRICELMLMLMVGIQEGGIAYK